MATTLEVVGTTEKTHEILEQDKLALNEILRAFHVIDLQFKVPS